jgi:hypothetical protein
MFIRTPLLQERNQVFAVIVAEYDVGRNETGTFRATCLGAVTEGAALLEERCAAGRCGLIRRSAQAEKNPGGRGPLFGCAVETSARGRGRRVGGSGLRLLTGGGNSEKR